MQNSRLPQLFSIRAAFARCALIAGISVFLVLYNWLYINWLAPGSEYLGITYQKPAASLLVLGWVLALLPALWMPIRLSRPSQLPFWFIYILVYIPSLFTPLYMALESRYDLTVLMLCLLAGIVILSCTYIVPPVRLIGTIVSPRMFWSLIACSTVLLDLWVIAVFHSHMRLVGFYDVYQLRSAADEAAAGSAVGYAVMLLSSVINPLYMAYGLFTRRKALIVLGFANQVLLYSAQGSKAVFLSVVVIAGLYFLIGRSGRSFGLRLVGAMGIVLVLLVIAANQTDLNPVYKFAMFLLFSRIFANGGYTTASYADFFHSHPLTYLSSVHGIDALVRYPYSGQIGLEIGNYEAGDPTYDMNAHLWASDGIAAFGPLGIVLVSILCALVFWLLDCSAIRHNVILVSLIVAFITMDLANLSLFTTLVSGGLGLVIVLLLAMPPEESSSASERALTQSLKFH